MLKTFSFYCTAIFFLTAYALSMAYNVLWGISIYGIIMIVYFLLQISFAHLNYRYYFQLSRESWISKNSVRTFSTPEGMITENPFQCVLVMVGHRERVDYWRKALDSISRLNPVNLVHVYLIIDGDEEEDRYMTTEARKIFYPNPEDDDATLLSPFKLEIISIKQRGKRGAMFYGIEKVRQDYAGQENNMDVVLSDSDTELHENCILRLQECLRSNSNNGCATGVLQIYNKVDGVLPRMIDARYSYAFLIERASTSYMGCMTCCSGPLSIYRLSVLNELVMRKFITQSLLNVKCEPGDDRHLTNLVLAQGNYARQTAMATAGTEAPETLRRFLLQQLRWSRSYYRELYWQIKAIEHQSYYLSLVTVYESLFPFFITCWLWRILYWNNEIRYMWHGFLLSLLVLVTRTLILFLYMQKWSVVYNLLYYPVYMFLLLPTKIFAVLTVLDNRWVTAPRGGATATAVVQKFPWHVCFLTLWNVLLTVGIVRQTMIATTGHFL